MNYKERVDKLNSLNNFINGEYQEDILLMLDKTYGEDKWSIICAVMHWFRVVESHLDSKKLLITDTDDYNWGEVYLYIAAVDIVTKGINDINKIVTNKNRRIFKGENNIFNDECKDDYEYFQNIRAIFGAHPTDLNGNRDYIVATYPTPYNSKLDILRGEAKGWDYYTLLWSKEKTDYLKQESFGFKFDDVDRFLDKHLIYLDTLYKDIINMINKYKEEIGKKEIKKSEDPIEQLNILEEEDRIRLNGRYKYIIDDLKVLISTPITDINNKKIYSLYKNKLIAQVPYLYKAIQNPDKISEVELIEQIIYCKTEEFDNMSSYYYTKLFEYWNNEDMEEILLRYFKNRIKPFNNKIINIKELFCIVKAYNYYIFAKEDN